MLKISTYFVGKRSTSWLQEAIESYEQRLKGNILIEWIPCVRDEQLIAAVAKERQAVGLDPTGKTFESPLFSTWLYQQLEKGGSRLAFVIGGASGLPQVLKEKLPLISLSPLTFTHELARLVLAEQIYRASEIRAGRPYHK